MTFLRQVFHPFIFSSLFISCCTVAQAVLTFHLLNVPVNTYLLVLVFSATLFIYNFDAFFHRSDEFKTKDELLRDRWVQKHYRGLRILALVAIPPIGYSVFHLPFTIFYLLIPLFITSLHYTFPLVRIEGKWLSLKKLKGAKGFLIAGVWAVVCVLLPYLVQDRLSLPVYEVALLFLARFCFISALAIYFDIRDYAFDKKVGINSLAVAYSIPDARKICYTLLLLFILLISINPFYTLHPAYSGMLLSGVLSLGLLMAHRYFKSEFYYSFVIDGLLLFQLFLVYIF